MRRGCVSEVGWLTGVGDGATGSCHAGDDCANRAATDVNAAGCIQTSRLRLTVIHKWPQSLSLVGAFIAVIDATTRRRLAV
jgi:hypothetical protein